MGGIVHDSTTPSSKCANQAVPKQYQNDGWHSGWHPGMTTSLATTLVAKLSGHKLEGEKCFSCQITTMMSGDVTRMPKASRVHFSNFKLLQMEVSLKICVNGWTFHETMLSGTASLISANWQSHEIEVNCQGLLPERKVVRQKDCRRNSCDFDGFVPTWVKSKSFPWFSLFWTICIQEALRFQRIQQANFSSNFDSWKHVFWWFLFFSRKPHISHFRKENIRNMFFPQFPCFCEPVLLIHERFQSDTDTHSHTEISYLIFEPDGNIPRC